jgi:hypothetical protein
MRGWLLQELAAALAKCPINAITPAEILVILKKGPTRPAGAKHNIAGH